MVKRLRLERRCSPPAVRSPASLAARLAAIVWRRALRRRSAGVGESDARPRPDARRRSPTDRSVAELVFDVSERTSSLIREEIELAKAEVTEKVGKLLRGSVVGIAAGTFAFLALILVMEGIAWLLNEEVFDGKTWPGFFVEAAVFLLIAAAAGCFAYRSVQAGAPPVPEQAIEEAKLTKTMLEGEESAAETPDERRSTSPTRPSDGRACPAARRPRSAATSTLQRQQLGRSVEALRGRVTELTDWRRQVREHRTQLIVGAAVVGFADRRPDDAAPPQLALSSSTDSVDTLPMPSRPGPTWAPRTAPISETKAGSQPKISRPSSIRAAAVSSSWMCWTTQPSAPDSWRWRA